MEGNHGEARTTRSTRHRESAGDSTPKSNGIEELSHYLSWANALMFDATVPVIALASNAR